MYRLSKSWCQSANLISLGRARRSKVKIQCYFWRFGCTKLPLLWFMNLFFPITTWRLSILLISRSYFLWVSLFIVTRSVSLPNLVSFFGFTNLLLYICIHSNDVQIGVDVKEWKFHHVELFEVKCSKEKKLIYLINIYSSFSNTSFSYDRSPWGTCRNRSSIIVPTLIRL